ncbi:MAG TPA: YceI family protein [Rhizomicrobium sp.]|nr:YceI family protein [Rhizomicrobium sp.]
MRRIFLAIFVTDILAAVPAHAAHWTVDYAKSRLGFTVQWSNEPFSGSFARWNADIDFDPTDPVHGKAVVTIDLASERSDEPDFDSGLTGAQGFNTSKFPIARFASKRFVHKSAHNYLAEGVLSLHGILRDIELPFTLAISGRTAHVTGSTHVLRTDFGVGNGTWSAPSPVSHDVSIYVDLTATQ